MLPFPGADNRIAADLEIRLDDREITDFYGQLIEVSVEWGRDKATATSLKLDSRRDERGRWTVQDAGVFEPWVTIRMVVHFGERHEEVLRGYIRQVKAEYPDDPGRSTVTVECQDTSLALDRDHVRRVWGEEVPTSDQAILLEILSNHGLAPHPDNTGAGQTGLTVNQDETDVRFLRKRAEANGYELIFIEGKVFFGPSRLSMAPQEPIKVYAGPDTNCIDFDVDVDAHSPDKVAFDAQAEDGSGAVTEIVEPDLPLLGRVAATSSNAGLGDFVWRMQREGGADVEELRAKAQRKANELAWKIKATGELDGDRYGHVLRIGEPVSVDGIGDWLGGVYYVHAVTHRFSAEGYRQSFELLRNAYGDNFDSLPGAGPLAALL